MKNSNDNQHFYHAFISLYFNNLKVLFLSNKTVADGEKEDQFNGSPPRPQPRGPRTPPGPPPPDDDDDDPLPLPGTYKSTRF